MGWNIVRIAFLWNGIRNHYGERFKDGLYAALQILKERHTVGMFEPDDEQRIHSFKPDVLLYWGALIEHQRPMVESYPYKKAICFAGGPIEFTLDDPGKFDLYFVESEVSEWEFKAANKPFIRAFGVNEQLYIPKTLEKHYDAAFAGTFALWKRPKLFANSVGNRGVWCGIKQEHEKECYQVCEENGVKIFDEVNREQVVDILNQSHTVLNTAEFWGGGQRLTLEAMACNIPPIVMSDSPKNCEYVDESGYGLVVDPNPEAINEAIECLKSQVCTSRDYIMSKWTSKHYADALEKGLMQI